MPIGKVLVQIQDHPTQLPMLVTKLGYSPTAQFISCPLLYGVTVCFELNAITSVSGYCIANCHGAPVMVLGVTK